MVLVTSVGAGDSKDAIPAAVYDTLKSALVDKTKAGAEVILAPCEHKIMCRRWLHLGV